MLAKRSPGMIAPPNGPNEPAYNQPEQGTDEYGSYEPYGDEPQGNGGFIRVITSVIGKDGAEEETGEDTDRSSDQCPTQECPPRMKAWMLQRL